MIAGDVSINNILYNIYMMFEWLVVPEKPRTTSHLGTVATFIYKIIQLKLTLVLSFDHFQFVQLCTSKRLNFGWLNILRIVLSNRNTA